MKSLEAYVMEEGTPERLQLKSLILKPLQRFLWDFSYTLDIMQEFLMTLTVLLTCRDLHLDSRWSLTGCELVHTW